ncbi:hypothetical protein OF820_09080 [Oceanotoga sp. DSM 15011]|uniref:hypothetical protein n=1 Tax=Oceanotoga sp. DSM 15011 TaxID=2984951 RepID=UPI0021F4CA9C|nr:hypothetical protein [Oceanotoga sp. DSM 15011]UYO99216.1 hypothetical protein OF820_09080 [Oceanotoga sp. DSM 15011]
MEKKFLERKGKILWKETNEKGKEINKSKTLKVHSEDTEKIAQALQSMKTLTNIEDEEYQILETYKIK